MKKTSRLFLLVPLLIACDQKPPSAKNETLSDILTELENTIEADLRKDGSLGSISAALVKGNSIVWSKAFGYASKDPEVPADTATIFRVASISKSFTSFLMMKLAEEGTISLDEPVELYVPEIRKVIGYSNNTKITFNQLANHTSGLAEETQLAGAAMGPIERWQEKLLESIPATTLENMPGEKFNYSNIGYGILGLALERAAKNSFIKLMHDKVFNPLGMKNTSCLVPDATRHKLAAGIHNMSSERPDEQTPLDEHDGRGYKVPTGGVYSTPNDLARFMICNLGYAPDVLSREHLALMHLEDQSVKNSYGLGFMIFRTDDLFIVGHSGAISGYEAQLLLDKNSEFGFVIMRNYNVGATNLESLPFDLLSRLSKLQATN